MASHDVRYVVEFDDKGAYKNIQTFDEAIKDLQKNSNTARTSARSFGSEFTQNLIPAFTAASLAADGVKKAFGFVKDTIVETIQAAMEAEKVDRSLESTLQIVGQTSRSTADGLKRYADALQRQTMYDDEAIKSAQTLIIQMRGTTDQINLATKGAVGLASVFQMDLQSAARAVAQGFEGNYRQLGMLIPAIREATTEAEKHAAMVNFFAGAYQRATDETRTFAGQIDQMRKYYAEFQENLGRMVTESKTVLGALAGLKEIIIWLNRENQRWAGKQTIFDTIIKNTRLLSPILDTLRITAAAAYVQNERYAESFHAWTAAMFEERGVLEPLPIIIREKVVAPLTDADKALIRDTKYWKLWGTGITGAVRTATGSLGDMVGGDLGKVIDYTETVPGLFDGIINKTGETATATAGMSTVWNDAMLSMTSGLVSFGDANATIWENVGNVFGNFVKSAISGIEAMVIKEIWAARVTTKAKQNEATASHISNIFKSVPFPLDLILAAGAFAVVNALFAKLFKFEKGGYFSKPTYLPGALVGEAGPEFILPEKKLEAAIDRAIGGKRRSDTLAGPVTYSFNITGPVLATSAALTDEMISSAASKLFREMENQARLRGRRLM